MEYGFLEEDKEKNILNKLKNMMNKNSNFTKWVNGHHLLSNLMQLLVMTINMYI